MSVCSNSWPAPRAKVYRAAARLCCATNFPFSFGTVLGGGGRSFSDTKPPEASGPMPIFTPKPVNVFPQGLLDFAASDASQFSGPHRLGGGGGRSCLDPRFPALSYRPKRRRLSVLSVFIADQGDFCVPCAVLCPFRAPGVLEQNQRRRRLAHQERRLRPTSVQRRTD